MGSSGKNSGEETYQGLSDDIVSKMYPDEKYPETAWFRDHSNLSEWSMGLNNDEYISIKEYTGLDYDDLNTAQYTIPWEDMDDYQKKNISDLHNALSGFELNKGIIVNRACDFKIFGAGEDDTMSMSEVRNFLKQSDGVVQNNGFMSFSTKPDGHAVDGTGIVIKLKIPPSVGAGAFIAPFSYHQNEKEFLLNNNAVLKFDYDHMYGDSKGNIVIPADWLGTEQAQTISPTYNGIKLTGKGVRKGKSKKSKS